jgi:ATP-dependent RNA helicase RhlE
LVATEVASRGLDIKELPYVVNYELPNVPEDYVHRIGRTGRAGATGLAVSLVSSDESGLLKDIERLLRKSIPHAALPVFKAAPPPIRGQFDDEREPSSHSRQGQGRAPAHQSRPHQPQAGASNPAGQGRRHNRRGGGGGGGQQPQQSNQSGQQPRQAHAQRPSRPQGQGQGRPQQQRNSSRGPRV